MLRWLKVGIKLNSLGMPVREAIDQAALFKAQGVEFDCVGELAPKQLSQTGRRHLRQLIRSRDLELFGIGFPTRRGLDELDKLEARVAGMVEAIVFAQDISVRHLIIQLGTIPADRNDAKRRYFYDALSAVTRAAEKHGIILAIDTGLQEPAEVNQFIRAEPSACLAVNLDPARLTASGFNVERAITEFADKTINVHVKDLVRSGLAIGGFREVPVGQGELNWERLAQQLVACDYVGPLILERDEPTRPIDELKSGLDHLLSVD